MRGGRLDPKLDIVFWMLFGAEQNRDLLISLLNAVLREAQDRNDEPTLCAWARFLTATADEDFEALATENPVLKQAKDALDRLSADPNARVQAEQREMALISYELDLSMARRNGIAEILQQQLTTKFGPLPAAVATRIASAGREELANWADRVLSSPLRRSRTCSITLGSRDTALALSVQGIVN